MSLGCRAGAPRRSTRRELHATSDLRIAARDREWRELRNRERKVIFSRGEFLGTEHFPAQDFPHFYIDTNV